MFVEPPRSEYDFHFRVANIPVRVSPWFWLVSLLTGMGGGTGAREVLIWMTVVFVSILIHELGHALVIRYYGWSARIVLYSFGGLAITESMTSAWRPGRARQRSGEQQIMISLAGPGAQFLLTAIVLGLVLAAQRSTPVPFWGLVSPEYQQGLVKGFPFWGWFGTGPPLEWTLAEVVDDLVQVNVFWAILNLMPIYPLDGGQIAREVFLANSDEGIRKSLTLSMACAVGLAVLGFLGGRPFMALMFGYMAYLNYSQLRGPFGGGFGGFGGGGFGGNRPWRM